MHAVPLCVYCRQRAIEPEWKPFCSERCKMADLGRWLSGDYRVPGSRTARVEDARGDGLDDPDE
jgi:endogenous inhibitor of DNA gyrase (YacG/DUF329 family)